MRAEPKIIVAIRKRPLLRRDHAKGDQDIVSVGSECELSVKEMRTKVDLTPYIEEHKFAFDAVFDEESRNQEVYDSLLKPLVAAAFETAKINVFAYGQTGSGKTFTMMGSPESGIPGLYLLAAEDLFSRLGKYVHLDQGLGISFYDIYCGKAYDLLNDRNPCFIRVDAKENVNIVGLTEKRVTNTESLMALIRFGLSARVTGITGANDESSRSHAILAVSLRKTGQPALFGRLSFIDLAGSERGADVTDTNKQTRFDGAEINKSLLALKECIRAMDMDKKYLPFRGSKLTMVLKDSFIGNSATVMIGNISPSLSACEHTLNTLRYADRVKELKKNHGKESKDSRDHLARALMLPRQMKNSARISLPVRTVEESLVMEHFDVNQPGSYDNFKTVNPNRLRSKASMGPDTFPQHQASAKTGKQGHPSLNNSLHREHYSNSRENSPVRLNSIKKRATMPPSFGMFSSGATSVASSQPPFSKTENESPQRPATPFTSDDLMNCLSHQQEDVIDEHSNHIDALVGCVKEDMNFLQEAKDSPTEILDYIHKTKMLLAKKMESILRFQKVLQAFEVNYHQVENPSYRGHADDVFLLQKEEHSELDLLS